MNEVFNNDLDMGIEQSRVWDDESLLCNLLGLVYSSRLWVLIQQTNTL